MQSQEGDIKIIDTNDGADFELTNGALSMTGGIESAVYLSIFGSEEETWMNDVLQGSEQLKCKTIKYMRGVPITYQTLQRAEQYLQEDLAWLKTDGVADTINIELSQTSKNKVSVKIDILTNGDLLYTNTYSINWINQSEGA